MLNGIDLNYLYELASLNLISQFLSKQNLRNLMAYYQQNRRNESSGPSGNSLRPNTKKVKNFSYCSSDKIGKGFSSIVYKGSDETTSKKIKAGTVMQHNGIVAVKCIDMKGIKDTISREMLDCQIQALKTLKHQNILECLEVSREHDYCYIITQFCNQGDLSGVLKKKGKLNEQQTTKILKDIVMGFVEIGTKGFLHRDLKLANIFMNNGVAKIADFGFAKKNRNSFQKQKYNVGSPLYMSPQALKKNVYSLKNDIWSIGIMAYELLHGETPWECRTEKELMEKMIRIPVRFKQYLNLSPEIKSFIKKCLEVDQNKRMSLEDLRNWDFSIGCVSNRERGSLQHKPQLQEKQISAVENLKPLNDVTNRNSVKTHRASSTNPHNKQNRQSITANGATILPKNIVDRNNTVILNQINVFRLLYKVAEKLKKSQPDETQMAQMIGNEVIKRVTNLKRFCVDKQVKICYDIKDTEAYLSESKNPSIKKYKSVISEYFRKYTSELTSVIIGKSFIVADVIKGYLKKVAAGNNENQDFTMFYWMIQYLALPKEPKKGHLDAILDPKITLNRQYISDRLKQLS